MSYFKKYNSPKSEKFNLMTAFKPLYVTLTVFGLLPYSLKFPKGTGHAITIHKSIYLNSLCSVSMILVLYSFFVLHTQQVFASTEGNTMTEVLTTKFNYMLEMLTLLIFVTLSYFCAYKNRFNYVKILNSIASCSNKFVDHKSIHRHIQVHVKKVTLCLVLLLLMQITINFTRFDTAWKMMLVTASFILPQMIQFTVLSFYYILVVMVVGVLENINEQIKSFGKPGEITAQFIKLEKRTVSLTQIEVVYVNMLETKREINRAFQASILATTIQCFHSIVSETHILYHGLAVDNSLTSHDICNCSIWIGYQLFKIYMLSFSGNRLKQQVAKIGRSLHNIIADKNDTRLYLEIQHFSSLILYQTAELTVYDFFPLDATLSFNILLGISLFFITSNYFKWASDRYMPLNY